MTTVRRLLGLASAAAIGAAFVPAPASAAEPDNPSAFLVAGPPQQIFQGVPDERIHETMEVRNDSDKPLRVVLYVKTEGLWFAGAYHTCRYTDNIPPDRPPASGEQAICEPPNEIEPGGTYKFGGEMIRVHPKAQPGATYSYTFTWFTKEYFDAQGPTFLDRDKMTPGFKGLPLMVKVNPERPHNGPSSSSGRVVMPAASTPPTTPPVTPTMTPPVTPPATPPATPTIPPGGGEEEPTGPAPTSNSPATPTVAPTTEAPGGAGGGDNDGGLPMTGTNVAVVGGLGAVLLLGGAGVFLLARRRTSFTA
ncbi:LPXTG cell wall anchor domain-containing protein [Actinoplanes sp. Pm04-4]|uniref:LPXTG cell wall anchor domain-containing protein n=1 Tax=Paractinoplanes pyxinae TaxID=2997416 RepID=A0ABT4AQK6_9ACTN|nr:LPXTG cell wall anchor domain-containing protein [Actinoplanes pyxinae]MCY1136516.1 LPXTG cell wall anchor domain-containing protein [Actinoplanes pyxinae]